MTEVQRLRLVSMVAAYAGVQIRQVEVISCSKANSTRIRFRMPESAARKLAAGFADRDPQLSAFLEEFEVLAVTEPSVEARLKRTTDTTEHGLESSIVRAMTGRTEALVPEHEATETSAPVAGGTGWLLGSPRHYDRGYCVDLVQLRGFLRATQPEVAEALQLETDGPTRRKFLARLQGEISRHGTIHVLRNGLKHERYDIELFYGTPSPNNPKAVEQHAANRFSVTRQLHYSLDETRRSLDLALFVNGLPIATFELKNRLTKQTVKDAIEQYRRDREPGEKLFELGRCVAHFAVDEQEVHFCTHLQGKASWFLPFNKGWNDGAGNPPKRLGEEGFKTDYLWRDILTPASLTDILENYAQLIEKKDEKTGRKRKAQIWPRYHQLRVVRELLGNAEREGAGRKYLIQHSAGSGKSNSIAWLAHQLISLGGDEARVFDSVIVVTDRRILDKQIQDTIRQYAQVRSTVGHAKHSGDLRRFLADGKKIIISTVQKFPVILDDIGDEHRGRRFAIIIDEAHSSQGGRTSAAVSSALSEEIWDEDEETLEDRINRVMEQKKLLTNASYFAFTATPKNKTLEIFGEPEPRIGGTADGTLSHRPFDSYTMKQAIEEGFILDVLRNYTPVESYYRLVKRVEDDPEFDTKKAKKKLRRYVEGHDHAIRLKAEIMVDHFHEQVWGPRKIGGEARAMVITNGIERAIQYFHALRDYLAERKSPHRAIVAFSGEHEYGGVEVTESSLNGFPSGQIPDKIQEDPYRFLVCADKFQTGYDEPLLHTMYVDKTLSGIKAVQTLSRLNRAHPKKHDVFVLDFMNKAETIEASFSDYYRTTILAEETDPNKLHDLKAVLDGHEVYTSEAIDELVELYLGGADRDSVDPILERSVGHYNHDLDEDQQVEFKGAAKTFLRAYGFLSQVLDYSNAEWEKLSIFLNLLVPKLPAPVEEDLSVGILDAIDMDSYRVEKLATLRIQLADEDAEIAPVPTAGAAGRREAEMDRLSSILQSFNDLFGDIAWTDKDRVRRLITQEIPERVAADTAYQNARRNSDRQNARIEHDKALGRAMNAFIQADTELYKRFMDDISFRRQVTDFVFKATYEEGAEERV